MRINQMRLALLRWLRSPEGQGSLIGLLTAWGSTTGLVFGLALPDIDPDEKLPAIQAGLMVGGPIALTAIGLLLIAPLGDKLDRRTMLIVLPTLCAGFIAGVGFVENAWGLIALGMAVGLVAVFEPIGRGFLDSEVPLDEVDKGKRTARVGARFVFGLATGTTAFPVVLAAVGRTWAFPVLAAVGLVLMAGVFSLPGDTHKSGAGGGLRSTLRDPASRWAAIKAGFNGGQFGAFIGPMAVLVGSHSPAGGPPRIGSVAVTWSALLVALFGARQFVSACTTARAGWIGRKPWAMWAATAAMGLPLAIIWAALPVDGWPWLVPAGVAFVALDVISNAGWVGGVLTRCGDSTSAKSLAIFGRVVGIGALGAQLGIVALKLVGPLGPCLVYAVFLAGELLVTQRFLRYTGVRAGPQLDYGAGDRLEFCHADGRPTVVHITPGGETAYDFADGVAEVGSADGERLFTARDLPDGPAQPILDLVHEPKQRTGLLVETRALRTPYYAPGRRLEVTRHNGATVEVERSARGVSVAIPERVSLDPERGGDRLPVIESKKNGERRMPAMLTVATAEPQPSWGERIAAARRQAGRLVKALGLQVRLDQPGPLRAYVILLTGTLSAAIVSRSWAVAALAVLAAFWTAATRIGRVRRGVSRDELDAADPEERRQLGREVIAASRAEVVTWSATACFGTVIALLASIHLIAGDGVWQRLDALVGLAVAGSAMTLARPHLWCHWMLWCRARSLRREAWTHFSEQGRFLAEDALALPVGGIWAVDLVVAQSWGQDIAVIVAAFTREKPDVVVYARELAHVQTPGT